jgi:exosortase E/protease (VPEID-CTERM system)
LRVAVLGLLIILEGLFFTIRFDSASLEDVASAWATLLGQAWVVGRVGISIVAALVVFGGRRVGAAFTDLTAEQPGRRRLLAPLAIHAGGVWAFYELSASLFDGGVAATSPVAARLAGWLFAAALLLGGWALALFPFAFWRRTVARFWRLLLLGAALVAVALVASKLAEYFWPLLCGPTLSSVEWILRLFYDDVIVVRDELSVSAGSFTTTIDAACSGFEGVGLVGVFVGAFLWIFRDKLAFPQALALLPAGMAAIWCANVLRIVALISIGASYSPAVAFGGFHSQAGWLAFNAVALGVIFAAWRAPCFRAAQPDHDAELARYEYAAGPYLLPLLMLLAVMMITTAFSAEGFDWLYPIRVAATLGVVAFYWPAYRERGYLQWNWSWTPVFIGVAVFVLWRLLEPLSGVGAAASQEQAQALASLSPLAAASWIAFRALGSIVVAPLAEELAFRGYLTRQLMADDFESVPLGKFSWFSFLASSAVFGALHGRWLAGAIAGMLFAAALYRRGRLSDAIAAHAIANALVTAYVLYTGDWAAWS